MHPTPENWRKFSSLVQIVKSLRAPDGCPWDLEQTHSTLTQYAIEEAYEYVEAVESGTDHEMCDELGDLLLQVVLNSEVARQRNAFDICDVIESIGKKMVRRHPHVFTDESVKNSDEVLKNWQDIKDKEGRTNKNPPFGVTSGLPALQRADKIGRKTNQLNFDWDEPEQVFEKVTEEFEELREALKTGNQKEISHEIGDLLFSLTQLARHKNMDAEQCLRNCNSRFEKRFQTMVDLIAEEKLEYKALSKNELEDFYKKAKALRKSHE